MSLLPLLFGLIMMRGTEGGSTPLTRTKKPKWPTTKSPPPSTLAYPPVPPVPPVPPMPAESGTPLAALHQASADSPQRRAAQQLYAYVTGSTPNWGFPGRPSPQIKSGQSGMGGVVNDGIYGPKTQARCAALLGHGCPARPSAKNAAASAAKGSALKKLKTGVPKLKFP